MTSRSHPCADLPAIALVFRALASPVRVDLLARLADRPLAVEELVAATGCKQANVSKHLGVLSGAHLVRRTRDGSRVIYSIADPDVKDLLEFALRRHHPKG